MTRDRLLEQAIELLAIADFHSLSLKEERNQVVREGIELLRQPKQEQEPVIDKSAAIRIATALGWEPKRNPLTDEEIDAIADEYLVDYRIPAGCALNFARDIEAAHGIKEST